MKHIAPSGNDPLDLMLRRALSDVGSEDDAAWFDSFDTSGVTFDKTYRQRRARIIRGEMPPSKMAMTYRHRMRIAIWVAMVSLLIAAAALTVSAVRESWQAWVSYDEDYFELSMVSPDETIGTYSIDADKDKVPIPPSTLAEFRKPRYIPDGIEERIHLQNEKTHSVMYYRDGSFLYEFRQLIWDGDLPSRYAENATLMPVDINGNAAVLTDQGEGYLSLVWHDGEYVYELYSTADVSREELLRIAQSVVTPDPVNQLHRYHLQSFRKPTGIPEGLCETIVAQNEDSHVIQYWANGVSVIEFEQMLLSTTGQYESAGVSLVEVDIGGSAGVRMTYDDGRTCVVWSDGEYQYRLYTDRAEYRDALLAMAKSVPVPQ